MKFEGQINTLIDYAFIIFYRQRLFIKLFYSHILRSITNFTLKKFVRLHVERFIYPRFPTIIYATYNFRIIFKIFIEFALASLIVAIVILDHACVERSRLISALRMRLRKRIRIWRDYPLSVVTSSVINSVISAGPEVSLKLRSLFKGGIEDTTDPSSISS